MKSLENFCQSSNRKLENFGPENFGHRKLGQNDRNGKFTGQFGVKCPSTLGLTAGLEVNFSLSKE